MKKLQYLLLACSLGSPSAFASYPCCHPYLPRFCGNISFSLEALAYKNDLVHLDFAQSEDENESATDRVANTLGNNYDFGGYSIGIGYDFDCTANDIRLNYLHNSRNENDHKLSGDVVSAITTLEPPILQFSDTLTVFLSGIPVGTTLATGPLLDLHTPDAITIHATFTQTVLDFEAAQSIMITPKLRLRFFGGLRGAKLSNELRQILTKQQSGLDAVTLTSPVVIEDVLFTDSIAKFQDDTKEQSRFTGFGPRFGLEANYELAEGFSLLGSFSAATLLGDIKSNTTDSLSFDFNGTVADIAVTSLDPALAFEPTLVIGQPVSLLRDEFHQVSTPNAFKLVPNAEAKFAITYCFRPCCMKYRMFLELGYLVNHFHNSVKWLSPVQSTLASTTEIQSVGYDGIYFAFKMHG